MMNRFIFLLGVSFSLGTASLSAHCQMPCGIYHDDMVYDQIDQYVETMFKAVATLNTLKNDDPKDRNAFARWVYQKDIQSDSTAELILTYFLMQKIKPGEADTAKRLESAHKLLFFLVAIKQNVDQRFVDDFYHEWEKFKLMFHIEGYECRIEQLKLKQREEAQKAAEKSKEAQKPVEKAPTPEAKKS